MATLSEMVRKHREALLEASDVFEDVLYTEARASAKSPYGAIMTLKKTKAELPDSYAGSKEDAINYNVVAKEIDNVISKIKDEALKKGWEE